MIAVAVAHDGKSGGATKLLAHLQKQDGQVVRIALAQNLPSNQHDHTIELMLMLRDGSPRADIALWHIAISPRRRLTGEELMFVLRDIDREFGTEHHPKLVFEHDGKFRAIDGGADHHFHLLLGHVGPKLRAINSSHFLRRLEKVMRLAEFRLREPATLGRHHVAVLSALRKQGQQDVANWLVKAFGERPESPIARMTSSQRNLAKKADLCLPKIIANLRRSWGGKDRSDEFVRSLTQAGMKLVYGDQTGALLLQYGGLTLGALNRFLRLSADEALALRHAFENHASKIDQQEPNLTDISDNNNEFDLHDEKLMALEAEMLGDSLDSNEPELNDDPGNDAGDITEYPVDEMDWPEPVSDFDDGYDNDM
jgi:hypothetical protein